MKYGIRVPFLDDEYLWATQGDSKFHLKPILFENKKEAEDYALNVWGENAIVEEYDENKDYS